MKNKYTKVMHKGVVYYKHYIKGDSVFWRCSKINAVPRCPARLTTSNKGVLEINRHNH